MKKISIALVICLSFLVTGAFASGDGAALYAQKCAGCHGIDGAKKSRASGDTVLKGQSASAIKAKLLGYADGSYGGAKKKIMERMVSRFDEQQLDDLAEAISKF